MNLRCVMIAVLVLAASSGARAEDVLRLHEVVAYDRPEAWALKYFGAATLLSGLPATESLAPGEISAGLEAVSLPRLSAEDRTVGFTGTKPEDLNKLPGYVRPRVAFGIPGGFAVELSYVPPVTVAGLTPNLAGVAVSRRLATGSGWHIDGRAFGQRGTVRSDFTCPDQALKFPAGSPQNRYGCESRSSDVATLRDGGIEILGSKTLGLPSRPVARLGVSGSYFDGDFQVDAHTFGFLDRTHLFTHGMIYAATAGVAWPLGHRISAGVDVFYAPLLVRRPGQPDVRNDGLINGRLMLIYRLR